MNFLREFFDRILMFIVFLVTVAIYWQKASPFAEQLVVTVAGGLLGMLIGRLKSAPSVEADKVETGDITITPENTETK